MTGGTRVRDHLREGARLMRRCPLPLIAGWAIAVGVVGLFAFLFSDNLSLGLQLGAIAGFPAVLCGQLATLRTLSRASVEGAIPNWGTWRGWISALCAVAFVVTIYRYGTFYLWMALPFSGGLMYTFYAWGIDNFVVAGRLDLLISAAVYGALAFFLFCGLLFAPLCAVVDSRGPFYASSRSWRMAGGQRGKIMAMATACFILPVIPFLLAYLLSVLETGAAVFQGVPAILWIVSAIILILFSGPWFTASLTALFVPLKKEEDEYMVRRAERRHTSRFKSSSPKT